jgi:maltose 6'-phosphate phosphatase
MKSMRAKINMVCLILAASLFLAVSSPAQCPDISSRGHLNVMTINLLFSEIQHRQARLETIAAFVKKQAASGDPVDFILLQEVAGGLLEKTLNSSLDLKNLLAQKGLSYQLSYRLANGLPGLLSVGNAILSRCEILYTLSSPLPFVIEEPFGNLMVPLKRIVMMSRVKIPGFGKINVYNTHLCAFCEPGDRFQQALVMADFIDDVESSIWGDNPIILGGDFNTDLNIPAESAVYKLITQDLGFVDTYSNTHSDCVNCCSVMDNYKGCTFAVPGNPYAFDLFTHLPETPERIDYIFTKGFPKDQIVSSVVFNEAPNWVSDHSAVLTSVGLP